jgi:GntR family transcriptional regulator, transcriptional repressor for pyruvate dehydrogenase complex
VSSDTSPITLRTVQRRKLTEEIAQQLLAEIRERPLQPGTRMPSERELMGALGVGRSTIREALNGLALLGVIDIRHGQGAFVAHGAVRERRPEELSAVLAKGVTHDLLEARRIVEVEIAALAASRRTKRDVRSIEAVLKAHAKALRAGDVCAEHAARFHVELASAAHNEVLEGVIVSILPLLEALGPRLETLDGYREWELAEHQAIWEAVRDSDPERAAERMRAHLEEMWSHHSRIGVSMEGQVEGEPRSVASSDRP